MKKLFAKGPLCFLAFFLGCSSPESLESPDGGSSARSMSAPAQGQGSSSGNTDTGDKPNELLVLKNRTPAPCDAPPLEDPCDCRFEASTCGAGFTCAVNETCAIEGGGGIPFSYESDENPGWQNTCVMVDRAAGLTGCTAIGQAVCCP